MSNRVSPEDAGDVLAERVKAAVDSLNETTVRDLLKLYVDEVRYLGDHLPGERRRDVARWTCSGCEYHVPPCGDFGGEGSCEPLPVETWCDNAGFGCTTCAFVDRLLRIIGA